MKSLYSFIKEGIDWSIIEKDDFCRKIQEVTGMVSKDFWSDDSWEHIIKWLKKEALLCSPNDTMSQELLLKSIMKCYWSGIPQVVQLATEIGNFIIKTHTYGSLRKNQINSQPIHFETVNFLGYMSLLAAYIEKYILKKDVYNYIDNNLQNRDNEG